MGQSIMVNAARNGTKRVTINGRVSPKRDQILGLLWMNGFLQNRSPAPQDGAPASKQRTSFRGVPLLERLGKLFGMHLMQFEQFEPAAEKIFQLCILGRGNECVA